MAMKPCLQVITLNQESGQPLAALYIDLKHYDDLKDEIDARRTGFREYDSCWGDGKVCFFLRA